MLSPGQGTGAMARSERPRKGDRARPGSTFRVRFRIRTGAGVGAGRRGWATAAALVRRAGTGPGRLAIRRDTERQASSRYRRAQPQGSPSKRWACDDECDRTDTRRVLEGSPNTITSTERVRAALRVDTSAEGVLRASDRVTTISLATPVSAPKVNAQRAWDLHVPIESSSGADRGSTEASDLYGKLVAVRPRNREAERTTTDTVRRGRCRRRKHEQRHGIVGTSGGSPHAGEGALGGRLRHRFPGRCGDRLGGRPWRTRAQPQPGWTDGLENDGAGGPIRPRTRRRRRGCGWQRGVDSTDVPGGVSRRVSSQPGETTGSTLLELSPGPARRLE